MTSPEEDGAGSVPDWESWTGLSFRDRGSYVIQFATQSLVIDLDRDQGLYHDQNVWMVHDLG